MSDQLLIAIRQSRELSEKANALTDKLKDIAYVSANNQTVSGVDPFIFSLTIFVLACFVGYYTVWKVTPALHTPLMAITNAISGIIIIGALIASSSEFFGFSSILGLLATFLAAINVFGGFIVTERMLGMFKNKK